MFANYSGATKGVWWGLRSKDGGGKEPQDAQVVIPLVSVDVKATLVHTLGQVEVVQIFQNKGTKSVDTVYIFPLDDTMTLTTFEADVSGNLLKGKVAPLGTMRKSQELRASLGLTKLSKNCLQVNIGILQPGDQVKITLGFINNATIKRLTGCISYSIPASIVPSELPPTYDEGAELADNARSNVVSNAPINIDVEVRMHEGIIGVRSPSHLVQIGDILFVSKQQGYMAEVKFIGECNQMNTDFVVNVLANDSYNPIVYSEDLPNGSTTLMAHITPEFLYHHDHNQIEFILALDNFCYKSGRHTTLAKKACNLFLHSLPIGCHFNFVMFGATCKFLFPQSVKYEDRSLGIARVKLESIKADEEGMNVGQVLRDIFEKPHVNGYTRQVFLISSANTINSDEVAGLIQRHSDDHRVFAIGITNEPHFNEEVIRVGGVTTVYIGENDRIDVKVIEQLKIALKPSKAVVHLQWLASNLGCPDVFQSPNRIPLLSSGFDFVAFAVSPTTLENSAAIKPPSDEPRANVSTGKDPPPVPPPPLSTFFNILHEHAAWNFILEMELELAGLRYADAEYFAVKRNIVVTSCKFNVPSKYTQFVVTDAKNEPRGISLQCRRSQHFSGMIDVSRGTKRRVSSDMNRDHTYFSSLYGNPGDRGQLRKLENETLKTFRAMVNTLVEGDLEIWLMYELIELQSAAGYFSLHPALCVVLGKSVEVLRAAAYEEEVSEHVFATALAISIFSRKISSEKDQWEMVVAKAENWLGESADMETIRNILEFAYAIHSLKR